MLQEAVAQVRSIQERLWPLMVGELGLASSILARCRRYRESYPGVTIESTLDPDGEPVPDHLGIGIYRVVEEFLEGIRRPAPGIMVSLGLMVNAGRVSLSMTVKDESRARGGRTSPNPLDTATLELIRRRVEILGGLSFVAANGSEVQLRAMWDMNRGSSP
jgi:signal transduction histidine kinase